MDEKSAHSAITRSFDYGEIGTDLKIDLNMSSNGDTVVETKADSRNVTTNEQRESSKNANFLKFTDIRVVIGEKTILKKVSGLVEGGQMMALMGPSGSGKSTLLNCIGARTELIGRAQMTEGEIILNNQKIDKKSRYKIGYVTQEDIFFRDLTVFETIMFYCHIRLSNWICKEKRIQRAYDIIREMELTNMMNTKIGGSGVRGLSGGERKRVSVCCELITDPYVLLLDEPTTGLDSMLALSVIKTVRNLCRTKGKCVIASIHQPNSHLFQSFDKLTLITGGLLLYQGRVDGVDSFFNDLQLTPPANWNIADYLIEVAISSTEQVKDRIAAHYQELENKYTISTEAIQDDIPEIPQPKVTILDDIPEIPQPKVTELDSAEQQKINMKDLKTDGEIDSTKKQEFLQKSNLTDFDCIENLQHYNSTRNQWNQLYWLVKRSFVRSVDDNWGVMETIRLVGITLIVAITWSQLSITVSTFDSFLGLIFFIILKVFTDPLFGSAFTFEAEKVVIGHERLSNMYPLHVYYISKILTEMPFLITNCVCFITICYWICGLNKDFACFLAFLTISISGSVIGHSCGLAISSFGFSQRKTITIMSIYYLGCTIFGGLINRHLPFWLAWARYLTPTYLIYALMVCVQFPEGSELQCDQASLVKSCIAGKPTATLDEILNYINYHLPPFTAGLLLFLMIISNYTICYLILTKTLTSNFQEHPFFGASARKFLSIARKPNKKSQPV